MLVTMRWRTGVPNQQEVAISKHIVKRLGERGVAETMASLFPIDCQTCNRPLTGTTMASVVTDMMIFAHAALHHRRGAGRALTTKRRIAAHLIWRYAPIGGARRALPAGRHLAVPDCFSITVTHHTDANAGTVVQYRVRLTGELDITAGEQLRIVLSGIITTGTADCIIVDLDNLAFLDSEGVRALLDCYFAATWAGKDFHVRNAHGIVCRVLTVLGLLPLLDTTSS